MPATLVKAYQSPDGQTFTTLADEQKHELKTMLTAEGPGSWTDSILADWMVTHADEIVKCLKQKERKNLTGAKPATRKPRKAKVERTDPEERPAVVAHTEAMGKIK